MPKLQFELEIQNMLDTKKNKEHLENKISLLENSSPNNPQQIFNRLLAQNSKNLDASDLNIILEIISSKSIDYARMFFQIIFASIKPEKEQKKVNQIDTNSFNKSNNKPKVEIIEQKNDPYVETLKNFINYETTLTAYLNLELKQVELLNSKSVSIKEAEIYFSTLSCLKNFTKDNGKLKFEDAVKKFLDLTKNGLKDRHLTYDKWKLNMEELGKNMNMKIRITDSRFIDEFFKEHLSNATLDDFSYALAVVSATSNQLGNSLFNKLVSQLKINNENKSIVEFLMEEENWKAYINLSSKNLRTNMNLGGDIWRYSETVCSFVSNKQINPNFDLFKKIIDYLVEQKNDVALKSLCSYMLEFITADINKAVTSKLLEMLKTKELSPFFNQCCLEKIVDLKSTIEQKKWCLESFYLEKNKDLYKEFIKKIDNSFRSSEKYNSSLNIVRFIEAIIEVPSKFDEKIQKNIEDKYNKLIKIVLIDENDLREEYKRDLVNLFNFYIQKNAGKIFVNQEKSTQSQHSILLSKLDQFISYLRSKIELELDVLKKEKPNEHNEEYKKSKNDLMQYQEERDNLKKRINPLLDGKEMLPTNVNDEDVLMYWNCRVVSNSKDKKSKDKRDIKINVINEIEETIQNCIVKKNKLENSELIRSKFSFKNDEVEKCNTDYENQLLKPLKKLAEKLLNNTSDLTEEVFKFIFDQINNKTYRRTRDSMSDHVRNTAMQVLMVYRDVLIKKNEINKILDKMLVSYFQLGWNFQPTLNSHYCYLLKKRGVFDNDLKNPVQLLDLKDINASPHLLSNKDALQKDNVIAVHPIAWALFNGLIEYWKNSGATVGKGASSHHQPVEYFLKNNLSLLSDPIQFIHHFVIAMGNVSRSDNNSKKTEKFHLKGKLLKFLNFAESLLSITVPVEYAEWKQLILNKKNENEKNTIEDNKVMSLSEIVSFAKAVKRGEEDTMNAPTLANWKNLPLTSTPFSQLVEQIKLTENQNSKNNTIQNSLSFSQQHTFFANPLLPTTKNTDVEKDNNFQNRRFSPGSIGEGN